MRKALIVFTGARTEKPGQFFITFLAEDAKTSIGKPRIVKDLDTLERIVDKLHGSGAHARTSVYNWGQGSEWVHLSDEQCRYFGVSIAIQPNEDPTSSPANARSRARELGAP